MPKEKILIFLSFLTTFIFLFSFIAYAWQEPTSTPPGGNVYAPVNVGPTSQTKSGNLTLKNLYLNATAAEGDIYKIDELVGYNDIFVKGNSSETAPVYLAGNKIYAYTNSQSRLFIDTNGNVGIGTTSPGYKLTVNGSIGTPNMNHPYLVLDSSSSGDNNNEQSAQISLGESGRGSASLHLAYTGDGYSYIGMGSLGDDNIPDHWALRFYYQNDDVYANNNINANDVYIRAIGKWASQLGGGGISGSGSANYLAMWTGNTSLGKSVIYQYNGNIGIGTGTQIPTQKLDVNGYVKGRSGLCIGNDCRTSWPSGGGISGSGSSGRVAFWTGSSSLSSDSDFTWDSSGNTLRIGDNLSIGYRSSSDTDSLYFDRESEYLKWDNSNGRFEFSDDVRAIDFCTTGGKCLSSVGGGGGISQCEDCDWRFVNVTGDTMTGNLTINKSYYSQLTIKSNDYWAGIEIRTQSASEGHPHIDFTNNHSSNYGVRIYAPNDNKLTITGGDLEVNKITVNQIDPVYKIKDKKYVTYMPDMVGQKLEVVGEGKTQNGIFEVDLAKQKEGSDLWLFYNVVEEKTIIPFVSSQSDASLYAYINGSKFVVKVREGNKNAKFSYRLIGTRKDYQKTDNLLKEDASIYIDIDSLEK